MIMAERSSNFEQLDVLPSKKRKIVSDECLFDKQSSSVELPSDTMAAILYIKSIFPRKKFGTVVPPIVLKHQIYCVVKDKTLVDRQLNKLWQERKIQLFKIISGSDEFALLLMEDFVTHVSSKKNSENSHVLDRFLSTVLPPCNDVSVSTKTLCGEHKLKEKDITVTTRRNRSNRGKRAALKDTCTNDCASSIARASSAHLFKKSLKFSSVLVNCGLLQCRDVGSLWLGIPGAGVFMKHFTKGRTNILRMIRRRKFKEILQQDLEKYKVNSKLGIQYHIYDIVGAELVSSIETTLGPLLRLET